MQLGVGVGRARDERRARAERERDRVERVIDRAASASTARASRRAEVGEYWPLVSP